MQQYTDLNAHMFKVRLNLHGLSRLRCLFIGLVGLCSLGTIAPPSAVASQPLPEPTLEIGIVQRFGEKSKDQLVIEPLTGDRLTLKFKTGGKTQTVQTQKVTLDVVAEALANTKVEERLVLSSHRSFESAEHSANEWRSRGIETEVAQPGNWQVWAKRDVYSTPLLRRLLLADLKENGYQPFLSTRLLDQVPRASFVADSFRYTRDHLEISTKNGIIRVDKDRYAGSLRVQPNAYGTYTLVNLVPVESYLRGVVPYEIGLGAPRTAMEAQSIIARTYALRNLRRFRIDDYELCADTQCQVYKGLEGAAPATDRAIAATRGQVLTYQDELIDALYSSTTGGVTAPFHDVWDGEPRPYLQAVVDSPSNIWDLRQFPLGDEQNFRKFISKKQGFNEVGWDKFRWRTDTPLSELNQDLKDYLNKKNHPFANFKTIQQLVVTERSPAGRVLKMSVTTDKGPVTLGKDEILRAFYAPNSTLFYLEPLYQPDKKTLKGYAFIGGGFGHGVGLSQTGSYRLGELGWSASRILAFYYPGTQLQQLNTNIQFWQESL